MKTIHFNCPTCERQVEAPADMSGKLMHCPSCRENLRPPRPAPKVSSSWLVILCVGMVAAGVLIGIPVVHLMVSGAPRPETSLEIRKRFQTEAQAALLDQCTNAIVGLNRIIRKTTVLTDADPNKWTAEVTAEYVNHIGGVDRTTLPFVFWVYSSPVDNERHVLCRVDNLKISQNERDALSRKLSPASADKKLELP